ncbi:HNH endonuclease signature motif containing protein [Mycolicibacterium diernhoferi]|uniref:HNH endonuclease n=1 Tax=Mycolicibacterium diernhoferi TaxID=1801 RepID=A0A1Q4HDC8_9MYCO|nr:HNH endonuclease signature motif containing protein [Mycolicibacterium diernhoferi]OJZ65465.1 HNH endonuclease [Mycolicibacterium diernhoferi]OPE45913.1 HNH endonuclease [Mycolicibacterium diernhoferi]PEG52875.1 HNH endonuclease [Mycolicibacterium diernhoferi]QYL22202.1 HNH endonuclease [Mycolicibacterium diernhoferi]
MSLCLGCGATLSKRSQKTYCSNTCQAAVRRNASTVLWLQSGDAKIRGERGNYIRRHIAAEQDGRCAICGSASTWQGSALTLILDHIDGNPTNNRRENLRLVCPNCDSQLPTYKSRNRGSGRASRRQRYADGKSY